MQEKIRKFLLQDKIAVVGASNDRAKYGNRVFRKLVDSGYRAFPINPNASAVEGQTCYRTLKDLPEKVEAVVSVVPPAATEQIVREADEVGIHYIWMQPGAESSRAIELCRDRKIECINQHCILVELSK